MMIPVSQIPEHIHALLDPCVGVNPGSRFGLSLRLEQDGHAAYLREQEQVRLERLPRANAGLPQCLDRA